MTTLIMVLVGWVGGYKVLGLRGVISLWDSRDRREQEIKIKRCDRVARVSGLYFLGQLQKTIRLQLSLFTNYRNSYI